MLQKVYRKNKRTLTQGGSKSNEIHTEASFAGVATSATTITLSATFTVITTVVAAMAVAAAVVAAAPV